MFLFEEVYTASKISSSGIGSSGNYLYSVIQAAIQAAVIASCVCNRRVEVPKVKSGWFFYAEHGDRTTRGPTGGTYTTTTTLHG